MESQRRPGAVSPLGGAPPRDRDYRLPGVFIVIAVLVIGILLGSLLSSRRGGVALTATPDQAHPAVSAPTSLSVASESEELVTVEWVEASAIPGSAMGRDLVDHSQAVQVGDTTHLVVRLRDPGKEAICELWSSEDGLDWKSQPLDLGIAVERPRLSATADGLMLVGSTATGDALWRADVAGSDVVAWQRIPLRAPYGLRDPVITAAVAGDGDIVVAMAGEWDPWPEVLRAFLPKGLNLDDEGLIYNGDEFLRRADGTVELRLFAESPQLLVVEDTVWVRLITERGEEVMQAIPLPRGCRAGVGSPEVAGVEVFAVWTSSDGRSFVPVEGDGVLPSGCFRPVAWRDGFVAVPAGPDRSACAGDGSVLWTSDTGEEWRPDPTQPPARCSPFSLAVSGEIIHLTAADGTQCSREADSAWVVLDEPRTSCYKTAGGAGILAYPVDFQYDRALLSCDGVCWSEIPIPGKQPYPMLAVLDDSLLALAVHDDPDLSNQIRIWRGALGSF